MDYNEIIERLLDVARQRLRNRPGAYEMFALAVSSPVHAVGMLPARLLTMPIAVQVADALGEYGRIDEELIAVVDEWARGHDGYPIAPLPRVSPTLLAAGAKEQTIPPSPETAGKARRSRRDLLTVVIERAQEKCRDPLDAAAVWIELLKLAEQKQTPLVGVTNEGLQYQDGEEVRYFSVKNLRDRLGRDGKKRLAKAR